MYASLLFQTAEQKGVLPMMESDDSNDLECFPDSTYPDDETGMDSWEDILEACNSNGNFGISSLMRHGDDDGNEEEDEKGEEKEEEGDEEIEEFFDSMTELPR